MKVSIMAAAVLMAAVVQAAEPRAIVRPEETFKIGCAGYTFLKFDLDQTLAMLKRVDVRYLCIKDFHLSQTATEAEIAAFQAKLKGAGVTGYAVGPIYMTSTQAVDVAVDYAGRVGVPLIVGVPCREVDKRKVADLELLAYVESKVKETGIRYAIHNHGPDSLPYATADEIMGYIGKMDPRVGMCLDIGHNARSNSDPFVALEKYPDRVLDVHIKNITAFSKAGKGIEMSRGQLDIPVLIRTLRKIGYAGVCSLEYEKDMGDPMPGISESIGYVRGCIDATR